MRMYDIISKKRNGLPLDKEEIKFAVDGYVRGEIPDYQMSALLMAICINSMNEEETAALTDVMLHSGDTIDLSHFGPLSADKHSTGGVGDKTTLIVAPLVASLGCKVAKMSGRGLGFTGGTIDKLESVSGYNTALTVEEFMSQVDKIGIAITGQTGNLVPADKKLYALRDVTATVASIPLIASSIMSKKLASGAASIILDVKVGSGAFMKSKSDAKILASAMVGLGKKFGRNVRALITNMDAPLGTCIGNSLEVIEAVDILSGKGDENLRELCLCLSANMLSACFNITFDEAYKKSSDAIDSGKALNKMKEWIEFQGGDARLIGDTSLLPVAKYMQVYKSSSDGYISRINAEGVGLSSMILGAGRAKKNDAVDIGAGIVLKSKVGQKVLCGDTLAVLYSSDKSLFSKASEILVNSFEFSVKKPVPQEIIIDTVFS